MTDQKVYVVIEGEIAYYFPYLPHGVFSTREAAMDLAREVVAGNQSVRWPNVTIVEFVLDRPGHVGQLTVEGIQ